MRVEHDISGRDGAPAYGTRHSGRAPSTGLAVMMQRPLRKIAGLCVWAVGLFCMLALVSWNINDPSLSHATDNPVSNWMGFAGASTADLLIQFFGLGAIVLVLPCLAVGRALFFDLPWSRASRRVLAWLGAGMLAAAFFSTWPVMSSWPLQSGLGGVLGDLVNRVPGIVTPTGLPTGLFAFVCALVYLPLALGLGLFASGLLHRSDIGEDYGHGADIVDEPDGVGDDSVGLLTMLAGGGLHAWYVLRSWMGGRNRSWNDDGLDDDTFVTRHREPAFGAHNAMSDPEPHWDEVGHEPLAPVIAPVVPQGHEDDWAVDPPVHAVVSPPIAPSVPGPVSDDPVMPSRVSAPIAPPKPSVRVQREAQPSLIGSDSFDLPSLHMLAEAKNRGRDATLSDEALEQNARLLEGVLDDFGVKGEIIAVQPGPVVTLYELEPAPGIKSSRVIGLAEDIARSMSAIAARVAVVPGRNAIGIELPNQSRETVYLRELLASQNYDKSKAKLALTLGKTINGEAVIADLAKMPHLLVAGTTGSGKSVAINTMILSLLYKLTPEQCRLIMIDPKMLELSVYDGIPHLLTPVVTDPKKAVVALKWTVREMEQRYKNMSKLGVRNIDGFNARVREALDKGEEITRTVQTGFDRDTGEAIYESEALHLEPMPYIVVIIDEMADLMMVAGKEIEGAVQRLAQMARAAGIHVIMATQRPSVDVITGTIKANFPTRISFQVTSKIDSRTILGEQGAEQLLGMGDMLYMAGGGRIQRVHGPFVSDQEVEDVVKHLKCQGVPQYLEAVLEDDDEDASGGDGGSGGGDAGGLADSDDPYDQAVAVVLRDRKASTSYIQRRLGIGYNRAASLIERMEEEGIISPANHAGKRDILVPSEEEQMSGMA